MASSIVLQQLLSFGWIFYPFFVISLWVNTASKYGHGMFIADPDILRVVFFILYAIGEPLRLYRGHTANLREDFPGLLIFAILTLLVDGPLTCYIWNFTDRNARDYALAWMLSASTLANGVFCIIAIRNVLVEQGHRFDLAKMTDMLQLKGR